jgi:23S rRNA (cytosine1962-C5)-methyltransferase
MSGGSGNPGRQRFAGPDPRRERLRQDAGVDEAGDYELIDIGELRRLERFGPWSIDRPAPTEGGFPARAPDRWTEAAARFEPSTLLGSGSWVTAVPEVEQPWVALVGDLRFELRLAPSGQVGCFPEQIPTWRWIGRRLAAWDTDRPAEILNLFAHTGGSSLAAARAGSRVVHVDAGRSAIAWARRNAELNELADAPIRWITDDAVRFTEREARRGRRYDGLVLDPPSFGHDPAGRPWRLETDLPRLLDACLAILADGPAFVVLSAHSQGFDADRLEAELADALGSERGGAIEIDELAISATSGRRLGLGAVARWSR